MYPPSPNWISKLFDGGKGAVIAGVVFGYWLGQTMARGNQNRWHDIARQVGNQFQEKYEYHGKNHGYFTQREHERQHDRREEVLCPGIVYTDVDTSFCKTVEEIQLAHPGHSS
jgi:hypothetical protein